MATKFPIRIILLFIYISPIMLSIYFTYFWLQNGFKNVFRHEEIQMHRINKLESNNFELWRYNLYESGPSSNIVNIFIFIHGHQGSPTQVMALYRRMSYNYQRTNEISKFYALSFGNNIPVAFSGDIINEESRFLVRAINYLVEENQEKQEKQGSLDKYNIRINILGHSFGGIVTLLGLQSADCPISYIRNIILYNAPTLSPPVIVSPSLSQIYANIHNSSLSPTLYTNISLLQISSGVKDLLVYAPLTSIQNIYIQNKLHLYTGSMHNVYSDFGHEFILASLPLIELVIKYFIENSDAVGGMERINWAKMYMQSNLGTFMDEKSQRNNIGNTKYQEKMDYSYITQNTLKTFQMHTPSIMPSYFLSYFTKQHYVFFYLNISSYKISTIYIYIYN